MLKSHKCVLDTIILGCKTDTKPQGVRFPHTVPNICKQLRKMLQVILAESLAVIQTDTLPLMKSLVKFSPGCHGEIHHVIMYIQ